MPILNINLLVSSGLNSLKQMAKEVDRAVTVGDRAKTIGVRVARRMEAALKSELEISYRRSGLAKVGNFKEKDGDKPGALYAAAVANVEITSTAFGLKARFKANLPKAVYARGGVFEYGGVRSKASTKTKQKYKKLHPHGNLIIPARLFFSLDVAQIERLRTEYQRIFEEELKHGGTGS